MLHDSLHTYIKITNIFCTTKQRNKIMTWMISMFSWYITQIAKPMWPTWGPPGSCRPQMSPMLAPWTLLPGNVFNESKFSVIWGWIMSMGVAWHPGDKAPPLTVELKFTHDYKILYNAIQYTKKEMQSDGNWEHTNWNEVTNLFQVFIIWSQFPAWVA